jgi:hypothetical protein
MRALIVPVSDIPATAASCRRAQHPPRLQGVDWAPAISLVNGKTHGRD